MDIGNSNTFSTTDLYSICVLKAAGFKWLSIVDEVNRRNIKRFHFEDTEELRETLDQHSNGELLLSTLDLINAIENVKRIVKY
jgi:hypothetical protein